MSSTFRCTAVLVVLAAAACGPMPGRVCTEEFAYGLNVIVEDEEGNRICDAVVTAKDGDYEETLELQEGAGAGDCIYIGAGERAGTYDIEATKDGFATATEAGYTVQEDADGCHVIGAPVTLELAAVDA